MGNTKRTPFIIFMVFHIIMKILPAAAAFNFSRNIYAESFSGGFFNLYLIAGYVFVAFSVASCLLDYRLLKKDKENYDSTGLKRLLIIDIVLLAAAAAVFVHFMSSYAELEGMGFFEFVKYYYGNE